MRSHTGSLLLLLALVLASCGTDAASTSSSAWSRIQHDEATFGGEMHQIMESVTAGGPGVVAVGSSGSDESTDAAVWTSPDGLTWSRVAHNEEIFGGQVMSGVTAGGPGLVAVGQDVVWTSPDGITWSKVVLTGASMKSVTSGGPGLVAVGDGVLTSSDGLTWSRAEGDERAFDGLMLSVSVGGPGLVAVGIEAAQDRPDAAVWTSRDGLTWSRVAHDPAVFGDAEMWGVTAGGPGIVAVGRTGDGDAAVWTSPDGIIWSRAIDMVLGGAGEQAMSSVTVTDEGLTAVGWDEASGDDAAVWTSPDGVLWSRVPPDDVALHADSVQAMLGVTAAGPGVVAVGWADGEPRDAAVWIETQGG